MLSEQKKTELDAVLNTANHTFGSHFYRIYWHMHDWSKKKRLSDGWSDITTDHIKLISIIARNERLTNNELAKLAGVTKQAVSQMVGLLEKRGALIVEKDPNDSRAKLVSLADYGVDFMTYFSSSLFELLEEYTSMIGAEKMRLLTELSGELAQALAASENSDPARIRRRER